jgi:hypothetical protein
VIGYSQDDATIAASTTDFIRVRMRVGTVAAPATGGGEKGEQVNGLPRNTGC